MPVSSSPAGIPIGLPADIPEPLLQLEWCAPFAGSVRRALHELKYGGERRLAEPLGRAIARRWRRAGAGGDVLVPVPVHAERARKRGYDQAALIAQVAARELRLPMAPILERGRATIAQFDLDRQHRASNVAGAFRVRPGATGPAPLSGRWVVLVDDVVTTGATLAPARNRCSEPARSASRRSPSRASGSTLGAILDLRRPTRDRPARTVPQLVPGGAQRPRGGHA